MSVFTDEKALDEIASMCVNFRAKHKLSQREMAKLCGLSLPTICGIESGKPAHKRTLATIRMIVEGDKME